MTRDIVEDWYKRCAVSAVSAEKFTLHYDVTDDGKRHFSQFKMRITDAVDNFARNHNVYAQVSFKEDPKHEWLEATFGGSKTKPLRPSLLKDLTYALGGAIGHTTRIDLRDQLDKLPAPTPQSVIPGRTRF